MWWLDEEIDNGSGIYSIVWEDTDRPYYANSATFMLGFSQGFEHAPEEDDDDSDEEMEVSEFTCDGSTYYRDDNGTVYDPDTAEEVGRYETHGRVSVFYRDGRPPVYYRQPTTDVAEHAEIAQREVMEEVPPPYSRGSLPPPSLLAAVGIFPPSYEETCALL